MKKYRLHILTFVAALGLVSCEDYVDVNENPNAPGIVSPELSLAGSLAQPFRAFVGSDQSMNTLGNLFMNNWAGNVNAYTEIYVREFDLAIDNGFYARVWGNTYLTTLGFTDIIRYESENYDNHKAIAKIMKTFYFQYLVDLYGDIPYTEAHDLSNPTPAYDDDQAIYRDLMVQLKEAQELMENADIDDRVVGGEDVMFDGDMAAWDRFANTLRLRLLIRESLVPASQAYINEEMALLAGADFVTEDVTINPGYSNESVAKQNPFYAGYGFAINESTPVTGRASTVASQHAIDYLKGLLPQAPVADPRLTRIFDPVAGDYAGITQGMTGAQADDDGDSQFGPGIIIESSQDGFIMLAAESYLLQAEAVQRGYMAGDGEALVNMAIEASFATLGNTPAQAAAYIAAIQNTVLDYSSTGIEAIMKQKYVALMSINGIESWIEYTRTGFPTIPLALTATETTKPNRLLYPNTEATGNSANVPAQTHASAFSTNVFWDVN